MNHLATKTKLANRYFALRHGSSIANEADLIVSSPLVGIEEYGLTEVGKAEIRQSVSKAKAASIVDETTIIVTSDFLRAQETATVAQVVLESVEPVVAIELRERSFGAWEMTSGKNYAAVWAVDRIDAAHTEYGVESAEAVQSRVTGLIAKLEGEYTQQKILLVSHGDALQILQTSFEKVSPTRHRELRHLETAELRELKLNAHMSQRQW